MIEDYINIEANKLVKMASDLLSEDQENSEYDRAISEFYCELRNINLEHAPVALTFLRLVQKQEIIGR